MVVRRVEVGTGITSVEVEQYEGADIGVRLRKFAIKWNDALQRGGGSFGAVSLSMTNEAYAIMSKAGEGPFEPHSEEDFAQRILRLHEVAVAGVQRRSADEAARFAFEAGYLYSQAVMKFRWEKQALEGERIRSARQLNLAHAAAEREKIVTAFNRERETTTRKESLHRVAEQFGKTVSAVAKTVSRAKEKTK